MQSDCYDLIKFLKKIGLNDDELIQKALTHPSFVADNNQSYCECYERLEFLGDAVLKLISSEYLYEKFPEYKEGDLSNIRSFIVSDETLAKIAQKIGLVDLIKVSHNDASLKQLESVCACAFEAVLGALHLCGKDTELKEFFECNFSQLIDDIANNRLILNPKAILQEYTQSDTKSLPVYETINETGAAHNKTFEIKVSYNGETLASGSGKTKKAAQQDAALAACEKLNLIKGNVE